MAPLPCSFTTRPAWSERAFSEYVQRVREEAVVKYSNKKIWTLSPLGLFRNDGAELWYEDTNGKHYLKFAESIPGTLAWDIIHGEKELPQYGCHLEIIGDQVRETEWKECLLWDDDTLEGEDCQDELSQLPVIEYDAEKHFTKKPTFRQEIHNLVKCQGSPLVVQLLGRTKEGELVFPRYKRDLKATALGYFNSPDIVRLIKRWMIEVIIAWVDYLHSQGIIHRDIHAKNFLDSGNGLVVCDLQCHGITDFVRAFELDHLNFSESTFATDVFALGALLWECCFYNYPRHRSIMLITPPPPPFHDIFLRCTAKQPRDRLTTSQLRKMYEAIEIPSDTVL